MSAPGQARIGIVGGGWAGLAAAVHATAADWAVSVFEMAPQVGGRARSVTLSNGPELDNGQHILIGAYSATLRLMRTVGADVEQLLQRRPLELRYPDGRGLTMAPGPVFWGFALGVFGARGWSLVERIALLRTAAAWWRKGMRNPGVDTVEALCEGLPRSVRELLIEPLCIAALNTPTEQASATVFLRVLGDALFGPRGSSDLLLPRATLSELFPRPAARWLQARGGVIETGRRVSALQRNEHGWLIDGERFAVVILACTAAEAARLARPANPDWAAQASALNYEPIVTVYLRRSAAPLAVPMMALQTGEQAPAQFAFDLEALGVAPGTLALVVSGARRWLADGLDALARAVAEQAQMQLPAHVLVDQKPRWLHAAAERRATFSCVAGLQRPAAMLAPGLFACGDYVDGPYPATLEGSIRSGITAAELAVARLQELGK